MKSKVEIIKRPLQQTGDALKKNAWMSILESLVMIVMGVFLIAWPTVVIKAISYVVGTFFVIKGGFKIINYFMVKGREDFFNNDLLTGVVTVIIGIAAFVLGENISGIFRIIVGIFLIYEALVRMNTAIKLNAAGINSWRPILIMSLAMLLLGMIVTFYEGAVVVLIGWIMLASGLISMFSDIMFIQHVDSIISKITDFVDKAQHEEN